MINNFAQDKIQDTLQLGLIFEDIQILFDNKYNVYLASIKKVTDCKTRELFF